MDFMGILNGRGKLVISPEKLTPVLSLPSPRPGRVYVPSRCLPFFIFNLHSECRKPLLAVNIRESQPEHILEGFPVWDF